MIEVWQVEPELDYALVLNELRTHTTEWLVGERVAAVHEQRRWRMRELAVTLVLDERGAVDDSLAATDGVSVRALREKVATARALEDLPNVAAAAHAGSLSDEQLAPTAKLADPESDREWAARAPNTAPADLEQLAREARKPSMDEMRARRAARQWSMWWRKDAGMLATRGESPTLMVRWSRTCSIT